MGISSQKLFQFSEPLGTTHCMQHLNLDYLAKEAYLTGVTCLKWVYNFITGNKFPSIAGTKTKIKKHPNERRGKWVSSSTQLVNPLDIIRVSMLYELLSKKCAFLCCNIYSA